MEFGGLSINLDIEFGPDTAVLRMSEPFKQAIDKYVDKLALQVSADLEKLARDFDIADFQNNPDSSALSTLDEENENKELLAESSNAEDNTTMTVFQLSKKFEELCAMKSTTSTLCQPRPQRTKKLQQTQLASITNEEKTDEQDGEKSLQTSPDPEIISQVLQQ